MVRHCCPATELPRETSLCPAVSPLRLCVLPRVPRGESCMSSLLIELAIMLLVILLAAELFTNALEHLGERLKISEGVTGSLFAAVGTALPETMVPLLAIAGGSTVNVNQEIGVGAILGAPLMLSTLSTCL